MGSSIRVTKNIYFFFMLREKKKEKKKKEKEKKKRGYIHNIQYMSVQIGSKNFGTRHISAVKFICEALHPYTCILDIYVVSCKMIKIIKIDKWGISFSFSMALYFFTRKNSLKEAIKLISFSVSPNGVVFEPRVCCSVGWSRIVTWIWFWAGPNEDWVYDEVKIRHSLGMSQLYNTGREQAQGMKGSIPWGGLKRKSLKTAERGWSTNLEEVEGSQEEFIGS